MDVNEFERQNDALSMCLASLRTDREPPSPERLAERLEQASTALGRAMEQLWAAEVGLRQRDEQLEAARLTQHADLRRYCNLFDFAPIGYLVTDLQGTIVEVNRAAARLLQDTPTHLSGRRLADALAEDQRALFLGKLARLADGEVHEWKTRLVRCNDKPLPVILTVKADLDWNDEPISLSWIIHEIATDHGSEWVKTMEDQPNFLPTAPHPPPWSGRAMPPNRAASVDAELARLGELVHGVDAIVWESDPCGRVRFVSRRVEEILGYPADCWLSKPNFWQQIIHPDDSEWVIAHRRRCVEQLRHGELEYRVVTAGGRAIWLRESVHVAPDPSGRVETWRTVTWNVDQRKKVEQQLYAVQRVLAEQLADLAALHTLSQRLWTSQDTAPLLKEILEAAMAIQGGEMGVVRLFDPARGKLATVVNLGLPAAYLERFGSVPVGVAACGLAFERGGPVIVENVEADPHYAPFREAARLGGFRAGSSTLLVSRTGEKLGTISVFFSQSHRPPEHQSRMVELFARQAADLIENARLYQVLREADTG